MSYSLLKYTQLSITLRTCELSSSRWRTPSSLPKDTTCWFSSMISASLPPFLDKAAFFLIAGVLCWTLCGVGMFLGTVGDVLCGPGMFRDGQRWLAFKRIAIYIFLNGLNAVRAMDTANVESTANNVVSLIWHFVADFVRTETFQIIVQQSRYKRHNLWLSTVKSYLDYKEANLQIKTLLIFWHGWIPVLVEINNITVASVNFRQSYQCSGGMKCDFWITVKVYLLR